ncbi:GNAT family N-acetyltransferase [Actinoplanes sp. NPDC049596]|uniref:GNAT family N-acetyltransferase n=1 Tax=unclassified Actinoplanes TaxID=2626549 RepID=UPI00342D41FA
MHTQSLTETVEADFMYEYGRCAPADTLGVGLARIGGGALVSMRDDPSRYWSKALGFTAPVTAGLIDEVLDFYREQKNDLAVLQIAPDALPTGWDDICATRGLRAGAEMVKLVAQIDDVAPAPATPALRVGPVGPQDVADWARLITTAFGMTAPGLVEMVATAGTASRFQPFGVWIDDTLVAGGQLFITGDVASLNTGATAAEFRGRGAQTALIHARIEAARAAGCRIVVAETGRPSPGQNNPSLNNMRRAGLQPVYARRNWVWSAQ